MEAHESLERFEKSHGHGHDGPQEGLARQAALSVAVVAAFLAIATFLGNESVKEAIQGETKVAEAKTHKDNFETQDANFEVTGLLITIYENADDQGLATTSKRVNKVIDGFSKKISAEQDRLTEDVKEHTTEVTHANDQHLLYELAEVLLQIAIVLASVAIIARRRLLLLGGDAVAVVGAVILVVGYLK